MESDGKDDAEAVRTIMRGKVRWCVFRATGTGKEEGGGRCHGVMM